MNTNVKKKRRTKSKSKMYDTFVGAFVNVVLKGVEAVDQRTKITNLTIAGFLLDEDTEYIYLGSADEITTAVTKDSIAVVLAESVEMDVIDIPPGSVQQ